VSFVDLLKSPFRKRFVTGEEVTQCPTVNVIRRTSTSFVPRTQNFETREWIVLSDQHARPGNRAWLRESRTCEHQQAEG